jgi:hypothetical protein
MYFGVINMQVTLDIPEQLALFRSGKLSAMAAT